MRKYSPGKSAIALLGLGGLIWIQYGLWFGQRPRIDDGDLFHGFPFRHRTVRSGWCLGDNSCGPDLVSYPALAVNLLVMGTVLIVGAAFARRFAVATELERAPAAGYEQSV